MGDLRLAVRSVLRAGGTSALAVIALALALGANTSLFALVHAVLLRSLPFASPERVVRLHEGSFDGTPGPEGVSGGDVADIARVIDGLSVVAAWRSQGFNSSAGAGTPERLPGVVASPAFFRVFPGRVLLGRAFDPANPIGTREAVLSERLWRRRFDADPAVLGRSISLNGEAVPVVGIMAREFNVPDGDTEVWITPRFAVPDHPIRPMVDHSTDWGSNYLDAAGRLAPGVSLASAQAELDAWSHQRAVLHPDEGERNFRALLRPYREELVGKVRPMVLLLWAAAGFTLLLACANVAALLLARAVRRRHEQAIRLALGAPRWRLLKSSLLEALVIAGTGAALGLLLATLMPPLLVAVWPVQLSTAALRLSPMVLLFTLLLTLATTGGVSLLPALVRAPDPATLRSGDRSASGGRTAARLRQGLIAGQVALALLLLASAGLMVRSLGKLHGVAPGFDAAGVVTGNVWLPNARYPDVLSQRLFLRRVLAALGEHPELTDAAFASRIPFSGGNSSRTVTVPGQDRANDADYRLVSGGYFRTVRIPLLEGRTFQESEEAPGTHAAVVNEAFVREFLGGGDPLGRALGIGDTQLGIIGVVGNVHFSGLDQAPRPEVYLPLGSEAWPSLHIVIRGRGSPGVLEAALRDAVRQVDPEQAFGRVLLLDALVDRSLADRRQAMELLAMVAALALLLAVTGIYGVLAHAVSERTRELGIRMALGATAARVVQEVVRQAMLPVAAGLLLGIAAALAAGPLLRRFLFGVQPQDPWTLATTALGLAVVALATNLLAARRTSRADPAQALQSE